MRGRFVKYVLYQNHLPKSLPIEGGQNRDEARSLVAVIYRWRGPLEEAAEAFARLAEDFPAGLHIPLGDNRPVRVGAPDGNSPGAVRIGQPQAEVRRESLRPRLRANNRCIGTASSRVSKVVRTRNTASASGDTLPLLRRGSICSLAVCVESLR